jgi:hypothetical protein
MSTAIEKLRINLPNGAVDPTILAELQQEHDELHKRMNDLEELLIMIVRTGWPWNAEGEPNAIFHASKSGFATAMVEAHDLLGLGLLSTINRTEPRT